MSQQRVSINPKRVEELAMMASKMDPTKIAQYNEEMEQQLAERMKTMTPQELENLATVQRFVTDKTVQVLQQQQHAAPPQDDDFLNQFDDATKQDQILLQALRTQPIDTFVGVFLQQNRHASSEVRFHSDNDAHPLLHWAALEDKMDIVRYLCAQVRVNVNAQNYKGETALHWACVKGHTRTIHILLHEFKAHAHICDNKGYSLLHIAAQNGYVLTMAQLNRKGRMLDLDLKDNGGRTPLHWACYRGYMDVCRWLLMHGADPDAEDYEKCSPLHWAAIRSHADVCQLLVQLGDGGSKLFSADTTGKTPRMLAEGKIEQAEAQNDRTLVMQYKRVAAYCLEWEPLQKLIDSNMGKPTLRMRISGKMPHASYFLWPVLAPIGFHQYCTWVLPATSQYMLLHCLFLVSFFGKWFFWARLQTKDPGDYVLETGKAGSILGYGTVSPSWGWRRNGWPDFSLRMRNRDSRLEATVPNSKLEGAQRHRDLYHRVLDEGLLVPVCTTCEIVKPARAKHDAISNVCVLKFDHFCPWMNSSIGQNNYLDFFMTALCASTAMWLWVFFVFAYTRDFTSHGTWLENATQIGFAWELFAWSYALLAVYGSAMTGQHIMLASRNMSTNEMISGSRYRYLVEDGSRGNPFNRGIVKNFMELFGLLPEQPNIDPEQYHKQAFEFGNEPQELKEALPGSPWYRKHGAAGSHGHSHNGAECHGH